MDESKKNEFWNYLPLIVGFCFVLPASNIAIQTLLWSLGISSLRIGGVIAVLGGLATVWFVSRSYFSTKEFTRGLLAFLLLTATSFAISSFYFETTWDGMAYHQEAILQLFNGWNPITAKLPNEVLHSIYLNTYPKASWINSATVLAFTHQIDSGKVFNMVYMAAVFLLVTHLLRCLKMKWWLAVICAMLVTLNSVTIVQIQSNMVDQINANVIPALIVCQILFIIDEKRSKYWALLACSLLVIFNTKFTSIVNAVMIMGIFAVGVFIFKRNDLKRVLVLCTTGIIIFILTGINPYLTNIADGKHPLHPVMGKEKLNVLDNQAPLGYDEGNAVLHTINSIFSESVNDVKPSQLKFPGKISWREFGPFGVYPDTRKGGFGPTFSLLLIVALALFVIGSWRNWRTEVQVSAFLAGGLLITVLLNPAGWWARLVPQLWLVPVILLIAVVLCPNGKSRNVAYAVIFGALMIQGFYLVIHLGYETLATRRISNQIKEIRASGKTILINFGHSPSARERLKEAGIPFERTSGQLPDGAQELVATRGVFIYK